jgi:hypothetical protein
MHFSFYFDFLDTFNLIIFILLYHFSILLINKNYLRFLFILYYIKLPVYRGILGYNDSIVINNLNKNNLFKFNIYI